MRALYLLTRKEIEVLLAQHGQGPYISIYLSTHFIGQEVKQGPIRLKNLMAKAEEQLIDRGVPARERSELLNLPKKLINDSIFWSNQNKGLAIFLSTGVSRYYRLPHNFSELAVVMDSFHIKPLLPLLAEDGQFCVLAISQQDARFLQCTRDVVNEIDLGEEITEFEQDIEEQFPESNIQHHNTGAPRQRHGRSAMFFSQGGEIDSTINDKVMRYFRLIDSKIREILPEEKAPIVLACVDSLIPIYKEASKYSVILDESIKGNTEHLSSKELHQKAWKLVQPYFQRKQDEARTRYKDKIRTGKVSTRLDEIIPASFHGKVDTLFVPVDIQQWGSYDPQTNMIILSEEASADNTDLLDLITAQTLLNNGTVYALKPDDMPEAGKMIAALMRY